MTPSTNPPEPTAEPTSEPEPESRPQPINPALQALNSVGIVIPDIQPGAPVADPSIGATGDDNAPPQGFDPLASSEGIKSVTKTVAAAVSIAVAAAGAAGAAAGAAGAAAGAAGAAGSAAAGSGLEGATHGAHSAGHEAGFHRTEWTLDGKVFDLDGGGGPAAGWGDRLPLFALTAVTFADSPTMRVANRVGSRFSMFGKAVLDGAYLRGMLGSGALAFPIANILLAIASVVVNSSENPGLAMSPPWFLYVAMVGISVLDAFAGLAAATVFIVGSIATLLVTSGLSGVSSWAAFIGVALSLFGPPFLVTGLRALRRRYLPGTGYWWERFTDVFVAAFLAAWLSSSIVKSLPALAGHTMAIANHVQDVAIIATGAAVLRVALEEVASRGYPRRSGWHSQITMPTATGRSKAMGLATKFVIWLAIASAIFGFNWQVVVGTVLFLAPSILGLFSKKFPNVPMIWKIMPSGFAGVTLSLAMASASSLGLAMVVGATPEMAKYSFIFMPIPLLIPGVLKEFGRTGGPGAVKPSKKNVWVYRIGGVVVYLVTLKLAGVF
mgnify:CR=1 FL=1